MPNPTVEPEAIAEALADIHDADSFIHRLLGETLHWPIPEDVQSPDDIAYEWTQEELRAHGLDEKVVDGTIRQIALSGCPWGIFLLEFNHPDAFTAGRGMTGPLRQVLRGLVSKHRDRPAHLPSFQREHLLFICTHRYTHFRFAHFKNPGEQFKTPPLASFGWHPQDSTQTVRQYNLPHLAFLDDDATVDDWIEHWSRAFDVERITKKFYAEYQKLHDRFHDALNGVEDERDRRWLASVLLNRLMFVYFLQKKGFLDGGNLTYLEDKLAASREQGDDRFYREFLTLLFFEGFAKPADQRSDAAREQLGDIRYLNGGLFLEHPIEQAARDAGRTIDLPDAAFEDAFRFFTSFSWNLNDTPGGEDNEINPDVLGYILEKYINQKAFGAYYTRPEITTHLCERTIHRLVLDAVNTPAETREDARRAGLPIRDYASISRMLRKLDDPLAKRLLDEVLPDLALLDPACGSGAFLVAAMKTLIDLYADVFKWIEFHGSARLRDRLERIRKKHPSLDYYIKKRIITDNLFGVDIMREAVEIARLRLFLALVASADRVDQLEPLPNIDFNILHGNSLIGLLHVDPGGFDQRNLFLPPYERVLADRDRKLDTYRHAASYAEDLTALRDNIAEVNAQAQTTLDEILLEDFRDLDIKYEQATWDDRNNKPGRPKKRPVEPEDLHRLDPFHWAFQFDRVMNRPGGGGFDAIITNPPWDVFKPNSKEFFEQYSDVVTRKSMSIHDFQDEQKNLLRDPDLSDAWLDYLSQFPHQSKWFRTADDYAHQTARANGRKVGSDLNLYKLFTERCYRLLRDGGQCGIVIPSGIYTDLGAKGLREMLFDQTRIDGLFCFENRRGIFEDVHRMFKFVVLTFERAPASGATGTFPAAFMRHDVSELEHFPQQGGLPIDVPLVRRLSPDSLSVMEFKSDTDVTIARKMLRFHLLGEEVEGKWKLKLNAEFHMTNDSGLFHCGAGILPASDSGAGEGEKRAGRMPAPQRLPLYEGKMIWHFDHRFAPPRYWVDEAEGRERLAGREGDHGQVMDYQRYRLGFRDIASSTNERTLISTIIPKTMHGNKIPTVCVEGECGTLIAPNEQLFLCTIWNSFIADWMIRQKVTTTLNFFYIYQLPVPRLTQGDPGFAEIVERAAKLICTTPEFDDLAAKIVPGSDHATLGVTDPAERAKLRAELDGMVAHLYGLTEPEFEHVLTTFPLVEQQVKDDALAAYRELIETGEAAALNPELRTSRDREGAVPAISDADREVLDLIAAGESAAVEFKSSARWDLRRGEPAKYVEAIIIKTVAAFLNTDGGTLMIGVTDEGDVRGLAEDFSTLSRKPDRDGFELWLMQALMKEFGKDAAGQIAVSFHAVGDGSGDDRPGARDACRVAVSPSPKPRFVTEKGRECLYVRTGNATNPVQGQEMLDYCRQQWPDGGVTEASERPGWQLRSGEPTRTQRMFGG